MMLYRCTHVRYRTCPDRTLPQSMTKADLDAGMKQESRGTASGRAARSASDMATHDGNGCYISHARDCGAHHVHALIEDDLPDSLPAHYAKIIILLVSIFLGDVCFGDLRICEPASSRVPQAHLLLVYMVTQQPCKGSLQALMRQPILKRNWYPEMAMTFRLF